MRRPSRFRGSDEGSAVVEFVTLGVLLLVPVVYLVLTLGRLQAAAFATEGAAREAGRVFVTAPDERVGASRAQAVVALAMQDQGFSDVHPARATRISCQASPCLQANSRVTVTVTADVVLPGVPAFVDAVVPTHVSVTARSVAVVERFSDVASSGAR
ncbi:MAG: pilus assembly protein [Actinomycetes bacterium]